jgi:polar amino acid transport system substrate-binding protein
MKAGQVQTRRRDECRQPALKKLDGITLTRVVTSTGLSADNAGDKFGFANVATDPDTIFAAKDTDTVFIATRHDSHAKYAQRGLEAGKNVFVEKPLALTLDELDRVVEAAKTGPGLLMVGFNRRFAPMIREAKAALDKAAGPKMMLYRVNAGEVPSDSWIQRGEGGGRIIGEVCHFVDTLTYLAGSLPIEAQAVAMRDRGDAVSILLRFADGSTGTIVYSSVGDPMVPKENLEVFAARTVVQMEDFTRLTITSGGKATTTKGNQDKGQKSMIKAFVEATRDGCIAPIPLTEMVAVTEATFAIEEALRRGGPIVFETRTLCMSSQISEIAP